MEKTKNKKRGRPRKARPKKIIWELPEGVRFVVRSPKVPQANTHRWIAVVDNEVAGYYKTIQDAAEEIKNHGT